MKKNCENTIWSTCNPNSLSRDRIVFGGEHHIRANKTLHVAKQYMLYFTTCNVLVASQPVNFWSSLAKSNLLPWAARKKMTLDPVDIAWINAVAVLAFDQNLMKSGDIVNCVGVLEYCVDDTMGSFYIAIFPAFPLTQITKTSI